MSPDPATTVELRFAVDAEAPLVYVDTPYPDPPEDLAVEVAGPGVLATLVVPISQARDWAGELCHAVAVAYREATGDPHALSDEELSALLPAGGYEPGPGLLVVADEKGTPARIRFHIALDIDGACLSTSSLRAAIIERLGSQFNVGHIAVSAGVPLAGHLG
jgi:hypothetical protein